MSIIVLAMVAAFLGLRLYAVLGKRTGHEQEPVFPQREDRPLPDLTGAGPADVRPAERGAPVPVHDMTAESGLNAIMAADRTFDPASFVEGAQAAYRMILEAFWSGDRDTLRDLCSPEIFDAFDGAITVRAERGETLDNRLVVIEQARIVAAELAGRNARVTVQFDADIAAVTRDRDGNVVAGSLSDAVVTHDRWTFERDVDSAGPDWKLDETESL